MAHRVGVVGFEHEANALADVVGHDRIVDVAANGLAHTWEASALVHRLHQRIDVDIVELPVWTLGACGPLADDAFAALLDELDRKMIDVLADGPLEALVVLGHGASRTPVDLDADATFARHLRGSLGDEVPIVWVLDFHANVSAAMCNLADVIVGYRTNPHVDIEDRLVEAADHAVRLLEGRRTCIARCATPLVLPQIALLTTAGEPLAGVMALAASKCRAPIWNVSVFGGFSLADVPESGVAVVVTAEAGHGDTAGQVSEELARATVERREMFRTTLTPLEEACHAALAASRRERSPVLLADVADNPGGGAPATSTAVLAALRSAGVTGAIVGVHCDPETVRAAERAGPGSSFELVLGSPGARPKQARSARPFTGRATVLTLADGPVVPDRGVYAGTRLDPGPSCAVEVAGIRLAVSSRPVQCADESLFRHVGLEPAASPVVVVKSRGHFRAGFDHLFASDQIVEVSAPGVATNDLASVNWAHLPRPSFPLDDVEGWQAAAVLATGVRR